MSAVDYPGLLAQLEQQDRALEQEREDLAVIIAAVRKRAGTVVPAGLQLPPARNGAKTQPKRKSQAKRDGRATVTDAQLARMRKEFEAGLPAPTIGGHFGVTDSAVYLRAKAGGWQRPKPTTAKAPAQPKGEQLAGSVRCTNPDCGVMTDYDPCRRCGKKLTRKGW